MKLNPKTHDWMREADIAALFDAFPKGSLRFVGGCVRNAVMGAPIGDIDLATTLEPKDVEAALKAHKIKYVPIGICLLYTSPSPRDGLLSRMPSSA